MFAIPGAHLQGSKTRNRQNIRAEPLLISAVVTCAVPVLRAFYSLVISIQKPRVCAIRLLQFKETFVQTVYTVANCAVVGLNVFYSLVLTCNLIFLQLWLLGRSVECTLHPHFKMER